MSRIRRTVYEHSLPLLLAVATVQMLAVVAYFAFSEAEALTARHAFYPVVWVTFSVWAVAVVRPPSLGDLPRYAPAVGAVALAYLGALLYLAGVIGTVSHDHGDHSHHAVEATGLTVVGASPGWGPLVMYTGEFLSLHVVPFMAIGYAALAYLVFVALLDTATSAVGAVVGVFSCAGCALPLFAGGISVVGGAGAAAVAQTYAYGISTVAFVAAVLFLYAYTHRFREDVSMS